MFDLVALLSTLGSTLTALISSNLPSDIWFTVSNPLLAINGLISARRADRNIVKDDTIHEIMALADCHETAALLADLIRVDGAGRWPPRANHDHDTWPAAIRPYKEAYLEMGPLLATADLSLDDNVNRTRIANFRSLFRELLHERVDMSQVKQLLEAADAGRWDVFPRDTYNAFYSCVSWCRHAYRWATIPVVRIAQLEEHIDLPPELIEPWEHLQRHFGLVSAAGNVHSTLLLSFDSQGAYRLKINTSPSVADNIVITSAEAAFAAIFRETEVLALPIYHAMVHAISFFARGDLAACLAHTSRIRAALRPLFAAYYDRMHNGRIALAVWVPYVQGFFGWGVGGHGDDRDRDDTGELIKFGGLSGSQVLLFQVLDAFLGIALPYLDETTRRRSVPARQRALCEASERHSFRGKLGDSEVEEKIVVEFTEIVKRLRLFRAAHRTRSKTYLSQPAPERLLMTAGRSVLTKDTMEENLAALDAFMLGRLAQTV